jgi:hypothetical protein
LEVNPAVVVRDAAANALLFVLAVKRRGVHRWLAAGLGL